MRLHAWKYIAFSVVWSIWSVIEPSPTNDWVMGVGAFFMFTLVLFVCTARGSIWAVLILVALDKPASVLVSPVFWMEFVVNAVRVYRSVLVGTRYTLPVAIGKMQTGIYFLHDVLHNTQMVTKYRFAHAGGMFSELCVKGERMADRHDLTFREFFFVWLIDNTVLFFDVTDKGERNIGFWTTARRTATTQPRLHVHQLDWWSKCMFTEFGPEETNADLVLYITGYVLMTGLVYKGLNIQYILHILRKLWGWCEELRVPNP